MKKKVLIWSIFAVILISIIILVSFMSLMFLDAKATFKSQEKAAIAFVRENYQESFKLIDARDVNFNAGFSEFYFYNPKYDFYFSVSVDSVPKQGKYEVYGSDYDGMSIGSLVSRDVKENFSDLEFIISTYYDYMNNYGRMCIKMFQNGKVTDEKEYEFLKYIVDNYENIGIEYFLLGEKEYKSFKDKPLNAIASNAGFEYESCVDLRYGKERFEIIDAADFDFEMYLNLKKFNEYLNDTTGSITDPFQ